MSLTRRDFGALTGTAVFAGVAAGAVEAAPAAASPRHHKVGDVHHLLRRTTYGATPEQVKAAEQQGTANWLEDQLHPGRLHDTAMDHLLKRWPKLRWSSWQCRNHMSFGDWDVMFDLVDAHIARAIWSDRQLLEIMVDFWSNHLNVTCPSSDVWDSRHLFDRDVIRRHALGSFSDMLCAAGRAPAMLNYLGNAESSGKAPNENWGRELLELHTVGLGAGYSQDDVHNSALILTGLSVEPDGGQFEYKPWMHHVGRVKVLGFAAANRSAAHGETVAMDYLRYLAHHPSTARHLATKLAVRFVSDDPPASLVHRLAATYRHHHTADRAGAPAAVQLQGVRGLARSEGSDAVRGLHRDRAGAADPAAAPRHRRYPGSAVDGQQRRPTAAGLACPQRVRRHRGSVGLDLGDARQVERSHEPGRPMVAAGTCTTEASARSCRNRRRRPTAIWSTGWPPRSMSRACTAVHRSALTEFVGHKPGDRLAATDEALGWRLPYLVALILDSAHQAER